MSSHFVHEFTLCTWVHTLYMSSHFVHEFTLCTWVHTSYMSSHFVHEFTLCTSVHTSYISSHFVHQFIVHVQWNKPNFKVDIYTEELRSFMCKLISTDKNRISVSKFAIFLFSICWTLMFGNMMKWDLRNKTSVPVFYRRIKYKHLI